MHYLDRALFNKEKCKSTIVRTQKTVADKLAASIISTTINALDDKQQDRTFNIVREKNEKSYLTKSTSFRHRNNRLRATFGVKRRGSYDWPIAEIDNQIKLQSLDYIPRILAYGYKLGKSRTIKSVSITTEFKENTYNVREYIEKFPERLNDVLLTSFNLIIKHLSDDIIHLDLWIGNILVNEDLSQSWLIDIEYLKHSPRGRIEKKTGVLFWVFISPWPFKLYFKRKIRRISKVLG